jgi:hypothetical protein
MTLLVISKLNKIYFEKNTLTFATIKKKSDYLAQGSAKRFEKPDRIELDRIANFENLIGSNLIGSQI